MDYQLYRNENYWDLDFSSETRVREYGDNLIKKTEKSLDLGGNTHMIKEKIILLPVIGLFDL